MKKNRMMRLASGLLVAVLLTTSVISGTFAKYTTKESASDTARVAKWGVFFDIEGGPLFSKEYKTDDTQKYTNMTYSVKSDTNLVAPGTEGELVNFRTTGTPEVSYKVTFDIAEGNEQNAIETIFTKKAVTYDAMRVPTAVDIENGYYPIVFKLKLNNAPEQKFSGENSAEQLKNAIEGFSYYFDVTDGKYYVNGVQQDNAPEFTLNWVWAFDENNGGNDVNDTTLGNLAAEVPGVKKEVGTEGIDYNLEIVLGITATATQID